MTYKIFTLLLVFSNFLFSNQELIFDAESLVINNGKKILAYENNSNLIFSDHVSFFKKYKNVHLNNNFDEFIKLCKDDDPAVRMLKMPLSIKNWIDRSLTIKDIQLKAFYVDAKSGQPEKIIILTKYNDRNTINSVPIFDDKGVLKIASAEYDENSPLIKIRELWTKIYPADPIILNSLFDKLLFRLYKIPYYLNVALIVLVAFLCFRIYKKFGKKSE
jgi:hypothetical protein